MRCASPGAWRSRISSTRTVDCSPVIRRVAPATGAYGRAHDRTPFQHADDVQCRTLFDAVASIAGVRDRASFEGQAAMQLEWLAGGAEGDRGYPFEIDEADNLI